MRVGDWMFTEGGEMYMEGKAVNDNGFICKVRNINTGGSSSEEWTYIGIDNNTHSRYCNIVQDCERWEDEPGIPILSRDLRIWTECTDTQVELTAKKTSIKEKTSFF